MIGVIKQLGFRPNWVKTASWDEFLVFLNLAWIGGFPNVFWLVFTKGIDQGLFRKALEFKTSENHSNRKLWVS